MGAVDLREEVLHGVVETVVDIARELVAAIVLNDGGGWEQSSD